MTLGVRVKLFLVSLVVIGAAAVAADAYLTRAAGAERVARVRDDLFVRLALIEREVARLEAPLEARRAWDRLADELGARAGVRVSVIRADGLVLGDSALEAADLAAAGSRADRPEVTAALDSGRGASVRWSDGLGRRVLYVAVPFRRADANAVAGVVRLALPLTAVDEAVNAVRRVVLLGAALALGVAVLLVNLAASWVSRPVRAITDVATRMALGDLAARTGVAGRDEVAELGRALDQLAGNLSRSVAELRAERDLLDRVLQGMHEGVLLLDRDGRVALANTALREMLLLPSDVTGKSPLELARNAQLKDGLDRARTAGEPVSVEIDLAGLRPRRLLLHAAALSGEPGGVLAVFVDMTDVRRLEALRRDFVANVSHELRTPITAVLGAAETLEGGALGDPQAAARLVAIIRQDAARLRQLVEDLLDLSRIESREFPLHLESVHLKAIAGHVVGRFADQARARGVRLRAAVPDDFPRVHVDRRALEQVLANLVENAVKYSGTGAEVTVHAALDNGRVRVTVEDTGPGIEARHLPRLFERFYRVDAGRSRELGNTGLGLAIVKHLVEAMGGSVGVESVVGQGTRFSFTVSPA